MGRHLLPVFSALRSFVFPPRCYGCDTPVESAVALLCPSCRAMLRPVLPTDRAYLRAADRLCGDGLIDGLVSAYHFEKGGPVQALVHALKYANAVRVGEALGRELGEKIVCDVRRGEFRWLIPVPLHLAKERTRGYNQSVMIVRGISRALRVPPTVRLLKRIRHTDSQTKLSIEERRLNVEGAFGVRGNALGRRPAGAALLVDDVITTGATVRSCAAMLRRAGVQRVVACSIALAE